MTVFFLLSLDIFISLRSSDESFKWFPWQQHNVTGSRDDDSTPAAFKPLGDLDYIHTVAVRLDLI